MAITGYKILKAESIQAMEALVAAEIADGNEPAGPASVHPITDGNLQVRSLVIYQTVFTGSPADVQFTADLTDLVDADTAFDARLDALEATINTATTGLSAVVADHELRIAALEP
jgi:hypothetical protein